MNLKAIKLLHYSLRLPITLIVDNISIIKYPETLLTSKLMLSKKDSYFGNVSYKKDFCVNLATPSFYEQFIHLDLDNSHSILIGPFLHEDSSFSDIKTEIKHLNIPDREKKKLLLYLQGLPILKEQEIYYIKELCKRIILKEVESNVEGKETFCNSLSDNFLKNKYKNRIELFKHSPFFFEDMISNQISNGNLVDALETLSKINNAEKATLANDEIRSLQNSLIGSATLFTRAAINGGVPPDNAFTLSDTCIIGIEKLKTKPELIEFEKDMLISFIKLVTSHKKSDYSTPISRVISYINDNLDENIKLEKLAKVAFLHPNYLSMLFNKEVEMSISQYILKRKIEESKHLVTNTDLSLLDISISYGFSSQSYFIKAFKNIIGVTPGKLRRGKT